MISSSIKDLEKDKFTGTEKGPDGDTRVRVDLFGGLLAGKDWDRVDVTRPNSTTDLFTYSKDSNQVIQIQVIYTDSEKCDISSVEVL